MIPPPRDFTGAISQIRSTPSGQLPTDADLLRSIDEGLGGTAMPGWKTRLSDRQRRDVLAYIKTFSSFFADTTQRPEPIKFSSAPGGGSSAEALKVGRQFYDSIGCRKCHGDQGRGDGPSAPTRSEEHTSELQSQSNLVCRLLLEKKKKKTYTYYMSCT